MSGLLGGLMNWGDNPLYQAFDQRRNTLMGLSQGFIGAPDITSAFKGNAPNISTGMKLDMAEKDRQDALTKATEQKNATISFMTQKYPDLAQAVNAGLPIDSAFSEMFKREAGQTPTSDMRNYQFAQQNPGFADFLNSGKGGGSAKYGNSPIYARNPKTGEYIAIQPGSDGSSNVMKLPPDFVVDPGALNSDRAAGTAFGTQQGGAQFNLPAAKQNVQFELQNIDALRNDQQGRDETFGKYMGIVPQQWLGTTPGTKKAAYAKRIDQVQGQNFLQAVSSLRGTGAISEVEGSKASDAIGRLSRAVSQDDFDAALDDLEEVLTAGYARMSQQASSGPYQSSGYNAPGLGDPINTGDPLGIR